MENSYVFEQIIIVVGVLFYNAFSGDHFAGTHRHTFE